MPTNPNDADILIQQIEEPTNIISPVTNASEIEKLTTNVVTIINDLASGLVTGSVDGDEFRVELAYEAYKARNLIGLFREKDLLDSPDGKFNAEMELSVSDFDRLITKRIEEYIGRITINDGQGVYAGDTATRGANAETIIPQRANSILHEGLKEDLTGYYKEKILTWVAETFMDPTGSKGITTAVDSLKELQELLSGGQNTAVNNILTKIGELDAKDLAHDTLLGTHTSAIASLVAKDLAIDSDLLTEKNARIAEDKRIVEVVIGTATDADDSNKNSVRGDLELLKRSFTNEKNNSDANDEILKDRLASSISKIAAINASISSIGDLQSFERSIEKVLVTKTNITNKFRNQKVLRSGSQVAPYNFG